MNAKQTELLAALSATVWGALPWSGEDASRRALRVELDGGYSLVARMHAWGVDVALHGGPEDNGPVRSPAEALRVIEQLERKHAQRAAAARDAADGLRAMIGGGA